MLTLIVSIAIYSAASLILIWIAGALYFDVGQASVAGMLLALLWLMLGLGLFIVWQPAWKPFLCLLFSGSCFLCWWLNLQPSQERPWDAHFARLPRVSMRGDAISIENVRNVEFDNSGNGILRFETRNYHLSELCQIDVLIAYWGSPWMCHPMFVFDFGPEGRVCFSIEVRYRIGQKYNFFRSLYRQQELMCVVCDERDAILRRIRQTPSQDVYLYWLSGDLQRMRTFFLEYVDTINTLAEKPRWYHGLTSNCTTSIYAQGRDHLHWDWRMLFNGRLDELLYDLKLLDQSLPFPQLKEQSRINEIANRAGIEDFGGTIRRELPGYRQSTSLNQKDACPIGSDTT